MRMTTSFSLRSRQPNVGHHHLSYVFERVSHVLNFLQLCACRALESRHTSHFRVMVSGSATAYPNCGKCTHLWVNYLCFQLDFICSSTSWSFYPQLGIIHPSLPSLRMCLSALRIVLTLLFHPFLLPVVSRFSFSRLHFPYVSTRPPPNEATPPRTTRSHDKLSPILNPDFCVEQSQQGEEVCQDVEAPKK